MTKCVMNNTTSTLHCHCRHVLTACQKKAANFGNPCGVGAALSKCFAKRHKKHLWSVVSRKVQRASGCKRIPSALECSELHHQKLIQVEKKGTHTDEQTLPAVLEWARSDTDKEKVAQEGLCEMQRAAAMSCQWGWCLLGRRTWEFWIWMVPGGSACVNTCPCDVTMATGWYRVPPEGIICRLWVSSGVGSYRQQPPPPPPLLPPLPPWLQPY